MLQLFSMTDMHARLALPGKTVRMSELAMIEEALTHGLHGLPRACGGYYMCNRASWWTTGGCERHI
jgi:hypothetical protein